MYKAHTLAMFILFIIIYMFTLFILLTLPLSWLFGLNFPIAKPVLLYNLVHVYVPVIMKNC